MLTAALATLLSLTSAGPGSEANGYAIIWGGGATLADADAAMTTWKQAAVGIGGFFDFPEGFPRIVESASVAGLKPGFQVVVLGLCPFDDTLVPLTLAKLKQPGAYGRKTSVASAATCPRLKKQFRVENRLTVETPDGTLRAAIVKETYGSRDDGKSCTAEHDACASGGASCPCSAARGETCTPQRWAFDKASGKSTPDRFACEAAKTDLSSALLLELRDANDASLDVKIIKDSDLDGFDCALSMTALPNGVDLKSTCLQPYCSTPTEVDAWREFTVAKKRIKSKLTDKNVRQGSCDGV